MYRESFPRALRKTLPSPALARRIRCAPDAPPGHAPCRNVPDRRRAARCASELLRPVLRQSRNDGRTWLRQSAGRPRVSYFLRSGSQRRTHRRGHTVPRFGFLAQALATRGGEFVELGPAIVLRCAPACLQQPLPHQAKQCGIKRTLLDEQRLPRDLPNAQQNPITMQGTERNRFQNEEIESAGKKLRLVGHAATPKMIRRLHPLS